MSDPVQVSVRSSLSEIIDELEKVKKKAEEVQETFSESGKKVEDGLKDNTKKTETFFGNLRQLSRRVADQLRGDFKALVSINALGDSLKLSNQFRGSIAETVNLSDKIRKLGTVFGVAKDNFASFQAFMTKGLGELGMSSDVAARSLEGLAQTQVRGQQNLLAYSSTAGMLASISGESGKEGGIARGLADVTRARGGNVNDQGQLNALAEAVRKTYVATGQNPTATLDSMKAMFSAMPQDMRRKIGPEGMANLASAGAVGGPNAAKFFEQYSKLSPIKRMALDAQGGRNLFTDKGLDTERLKKFIDTLSSRTGGDPRLGLTTAGIDEEAAEGLIRLRENLEDVTKAQEAMAKATGSLNQQYKDSMGFTEAFKANLNRVKKMLAEPLATVTQKGTDLLSATSESDLGAGAVALGGGLLASVLAGKGLKGLGKGLKGIGATAAKGAAAEAITGEKTIPVYVVNASEIGGGLGDLGGAAAGMGGKAGKAMGLLGKAGGILGAAFIGHEIGNLLEPYFAQLLEKTPKTNQGGVEMNAGDRFAYMLDKIFGGEMSKELDARDKAMRENDAKNGVKPKVVVPNDATQQNKETIREKTEKTTNVVQPTPNPFGAQTKIIFENSPPGLKARVKTPSTGASN